MSRADDEQQHDCHLNHYDHIVGVRRFFDADHQQQRDDGDNDDGWQIEYGRHLRSIRQSNKRPARCG